MLHLYVRWIATAVGAVLLAIVALLAWWRVA
jgi:hypothetical protein